MLPGVKSAQGNAGMAAGFSERETQDAALPASLPGATGSAKCDEPHGRHGLTAADKEGERNCTAAWRERVRTTRPSSSSPRQEAGPEEPPHTHTFAAANDKRAAGPGGAKGHPASDLRGLLPDQLREMPRFLGKPRQVPVVIRFLLRVLQGGRGARVGGGKRQPMPSCGRSLQRSPAPAAPLTHRSPMSLHKLSEDRHVW